MNELLRKRNEVLNNNSAWISEEDLKRNGVPFTKVIQKKGDVVIVPQDMIHQVLNIDDMTVSIAYNYIDERNFNACITNYQNSLTHGFNFLNSVPNMPHIMCGASLEKNSIICNGALIKYYFNHLPVDEDIKRFKLIQTKKKFEKICNICNDRLFLSFVKRLIMVGSIPDQLTIFCLNCAKKYTHYLFVYGRFRISIPDIA